MTYDVIVEVQHPERAELIPYACGHAHPTKQHALPCTRRAHAELDRLGIAKVTVIVTETRVDCEPYRALHPELNLEQRSMRRHVKRKRSDVQAVKQMLNKCLELLQNKNY